MFRSSSYKVSFVFALALHMVLCVFLFIKFKHSRSLGLVPGDIINAVAINEYDFNKQMNKRVANKNSLTQQKKTAAKPPKVVRQPASIKKTIIKKSSPKQLQTMLRQDLLREQAEELAELKKEQKKYKKTVAKLEEQELQKTGQEQIDAEQKDLSNISGGEASAALLQGEVDKYKALVKHAIDSQWIKPEGVVPGDFCELLINIAPGGVVLDVKLVHSSGNLVLDRSAQAAVLKASPLPVPEDPKLFDRFRVVKPMFKPEGIVGN